jgi:hypothetical protein
MDLRGYTLSRVMGTHYATAAIWRNDLGLELRALHGDELVESRLSRYGEAPVLLIAEEVKANLIAPKMDGGAEPQEVGYIDSSHYGV